MQKHALNDRRPLFLVVQLCSAPSFYTWQTSFGSLKVIIALLLINPGDCVIVDES